MSILTLAWTICILLRVSTAKVYFKETFDDSSWEERWVVSEYKRGLGRFELTSGDWYVNRAVNRGIKTTEDMKNYAISSKFAEPFSNRGKDLVIQFSVKHETWKFNFCGGGYIKLLPSTLDQLEFQGDSHYSIMFGPDLCANDVSRIHLIFNDGTKNLLKRDDINLEFRDKNEYTHVYTVVIHRDNTYHVYFDFKEKSHGDLISGWDWPTDREVYTKTRKPDNWVDNEFIEDPNARKPSNWDDIPKEIPDPDATKPDIWDDESDGEWDIPLMDNPDWAAEWKRPIIKNPDYKGEWKPKRIKNPNWKEDVYAYDDLAYVGIDLWTVNHGTIFDNIYIGDNYDDAKDWGMNLWKETSEKERDAKENPDKYRNLSPDITDIPDAVDDIDLSDLDDIDEDYEFDIPDDEHREL